MKKTVRILLTILFFILVVTGNILVMRTSHRWFINTEDLDKNNIEVSMDKEGLIEVDEISFDEKHERICIVLKPVKKGSVKITVNSDEEGNLREL